MIRAAVAGDRAHPAPVLDPPQLQDEFLDTDC